MAEGIIDSGLGSSAVEEEVEEEECAGLEPFFFDEAVVVAEHAAAEEKRRKKEQEEDLKKERMMQKAIAYQSVLDKITEYDPKLGCEYITRFYMADLSVFDLDEESPLGPMRYTETQTEKSSGEYGTMCRQGKKSFYPENSANVISVKITSSDVGFPIYVYGTVIARDSLDWKCLYLFNRDRDTCQLINSKDDQLILTGPKRGLALIDAIYFEMDLKIMAEQGQEDKKLSKGVLRLDGIQHQFLDTMFVDSDSIETQISTVEVTYAVVQRAVEATIAVEVVQGQFDGTITACTTSIPQSLVLYDDKVACAMTGGNGNRSIRLLRPVVAVCIDEMLELTIAQGKTEGKIPFTPDVNGGDEAEYTCGPLTMLVKVTWSIIAC